MPRPVRVPLRSQFFIAFAFLAGFATLASAQSVSLSVDASINGGNPPVAGTTSTYTITVSNEGPDDALNAQLSTGVPAGTTLQSFTPAAGWSCVAQTCSIAAFPPGSAVFTLVVNVPRSTAQGTPITLDASVTTTSPDPDSNDNSVSLTAPVVWQSSLAISKSAPATAAAGASITYTLDGTNAGPSDAAGVTLNDALPAGLIVDSITAPGWSCGGSLTCTMAVFGTSGTVTILGHTSPAAPPQTLINDADVSATTEPNTRTASASTTVTQSADLSITKTATPLVAGTDVTYTITVTNAGPSDASSLALADVLPPTLTFQSITAPGWSCVAANCTRATLAAGSSVITLVAHVPPSTPSGTVIANTATVSSTTFDPSTPNSATASGSVSRQADLAVTIAGPPPVYTIVVTNNGPSDAASPSMSVALPPGVTFASVVAPPGWSCLGTVTCTASSLAASATATFTVNVSPATRGGVSIVTTASVASSTPDPSPANNSATDTSVPAGSIPAMSHVALVALALMLAFLALRK